jgi:hypothetical protein
MLLNTMPRKRLENQAHALAQLRLSDAIHSARQCHFTLQLGTSRNRAAAVSFIPHPANFIPVCPVVPPEFAFVARNKAQSFAQR